MKKTSKNQLLRASALSTAVLVGTVTAGVAVAGASSSHKAHDTTTTTTTVAQNAPGHQGPCNFAGGTVSAISATSLTVTTPSGTSVTYTLNSSTTYSDNGVATTESAITTGEEVFVIVTSSGSTTAASVNVVTLQPRAHLHASGIVSAVSSSSITIANYAGVSATYTVTSSTTVTDGKTSATLSSIAVGDYVDISTSSASSTTATSINVQPAFVAGKVTSVSGNAITVSSWNNSTKTVDVSTSTTYTETKNAASLNDVTTGSFIFAQGTFVAGSLSTLNATSVAIGQTGNFSTASPSRDNSFDGYAGTDNMAPKGRH